jgi:hypothetical protein
MIAQKLGRTTYSDGHKDEVAPPLNVTDEHWGNHHHEEVLSIKISGQAIECMDTSIYPKPLDTIGYCRTTKSDMKREDLRSIYPGSTVYS